MPQRPVPGRQPANVYRVRRAIAATIAVVVLFLLWQLVSPFTGGGDETTATTAAPTTTTTLAPPPDCAEGEVVVARDPHVARSTHPVGLVIAAGTESAGEFCAIWVGDQSIKKT